MWRRSRRRGETRGAGEKERRDAFLIRPAGRRPARRETDVRKLRSGPGQIFLSQHKHKTEVSTTLMLMREVTPLRVSTFGINRRRRPRSPPPLHHVFCFPIFVIIIKST